MIASSQGLVAQKLDAKELLIIVRLARGHFSRRFVVVSIAVEEHELAS